MASLQKGCVNFFYSHVGRDKLSIHQLDKGTLGLQSSSRSASSRQVTKYHYNNKSKSKEQFPTWSQNWLPTTKTHLEPDILEYEVKWALGSITMNKASGGDGIPVELFQILKHNAVKVLHSICQQIWKTEQWPQDCGKCPFSFQTQRQCQRMFKLPHNCTHLTC